MSQQVAKLVAKLRFGLAVCLAVSAWLALWVYSALAVLAAGIAPPGRAGQIRLALAELAEEWAWQFTRLPRKGGGGE